MKMYPLYPLMFRPIYKDYLWGGHAIAERFNRAMTPTVCAESWELSDLPGSVSVVTNGSFEGVALDQLVQTFGTDLLGSASPTVERFPLLVKLLDAHERLSVQVHPHDTPDAKHEMWFVLDAKPGARLWAGAQPEATFETVSAYLTEYVTAPGDVFDIPAGLIHCIGPGNLIYEVQQASDVTYRVSDWGRGRQLHHEEAKRAIRWDLATQLTHAPERRMRDLQMRLSTPDFAFATLRLERTRSLHTTAQSFMVLFCTAGKTTLDHDGPHPLTLLPGDLVLIPPKQRVTLHPLMSTHLLVTTL